LPIFCDSGIRKFIDLYTKPNKLDDIIGRGKACEISEEIGGNLTFTNHVFNIVEEVDVELKVSIASSLTLIGIVNSNKITTFFIMRSLRIPTIHL
jgi:hypothetical protein